MAQTFKDNGYFTYKIDNTTDCDMKINILDLDISLLNHFDIIWASPPCTAFSVASIGKNWDKDTREPKSEKALLGLNILEKTISIISQMQPTYWYIENPRGMMRKVIDKIFEKYGITTVIRHTVTYCQYGETRMKPTDIWTNNPNWKPRPMCKNGNSCHVSAPRGSRTGTQGLKNNFERSKLPKELCEEIVLISEGK